LIIGPHLFVGLAVAVMVIATASLGPSLQKGKDWARGLHVTIKGGSAAVVRLAGLHRHRHRPEAAEFSDSTNVPWHLIRWRSPLRSSGWQS
jgi:hypothetical protein